MSADAFNGGSSLERLSEFAMERYTRYVIKPLIRRVSQLTHEQLRALVAAADEAEDNLETDSMERFMKSSVGGMAMAALKVKFGENFQPKGKALSE